MYLPPNYNFMNYAQPPFQQSIPTQPITPGVYPPYYARGKIRSPVAPYQRFGFNGNYLKSPLSWLRILLIPSLIAAIIASALVRNRDWAVRRQSSYDTSTWISTLVFACVGLFVNLIAFLMYLFNIPNIRGCKFYPWTILFGLFDLAWFVALLVLGIFSAIREGTNRRDFRNMSLNQGAFGVASAFSLLASLLFLLSGLAHLIRRRAPLRTLPMSTHY